MAENEPVERDTQEPEPRGVTRETHEWVSGEDAGAVITNSGAFPGGPEMESWKRVPKQDESPEGTIEEQAANLRDRVDNG